MPSPLQPQLHNRIFCSLDLLRLRQLPGQPQQCSIHQSFPNSEVREKNVVLSHKPHPAQSQVRSDLNKSTAQIFLERPTPAHGSGMKFQNCTAEFLYHHISHTVQQRCDLIREGPVLNSRSAGRTYILFSPLLYGSPLYVTVPLGTP